jgi:uncharacterized membrane-anchored protein
MTSEPQSTPLDASIFQLQSHPLREGMSSEMHSRKLPPLSAPARLMQVVVVVGESEADEEWVRLSDLCRQAGSAPERGKYVSCAIGEFHLIWERHTEFSSYMFIKPGAYESPFDPSVFGALRRDWKFEMPRNVIRATQLAVAASEDPAAVRDNFIQNDLVVCDLADGAARMWADFRIHPGGFGRVLIVDKGMGAESALIVQRLQELGNYRNMALLGLPVAQRLTPTVSDLEKRLSRLAGEIAAGTSPDDDVLQDLSQLSAELAALVSETRYRMSASSAYSEISQDRLQSLRVGRVRGYQTLGDFTDRRLLPAVRTCISFSGRLEDLSQRVAWTSALLRTRVDTALSRQNRDLLASMDRRTDLQLRLQLTVEGLSVVAISYYVVGLTGYAARGLESVFAPIKHDLLVAIATPLIVIGVWWGMRRLRSRLHGTEPH